MADGTLSTAESGYYARHLCMPRFGVEGQLALRRSSVLVVGAGGLGSPVIQYLAAAGVGRLGIVDDDRVELSNLHRQVQFTTDDLGKSKAQAAADRARRQNPHIEAVAEPCRVDASNARALVARYDVIVDGTDNFTTKFVLNDACYFEHKPLVYGSIYQFEGQVSVFNVDVGGERGPNYRDLFPTPPPPELAPNCSEAGVLGVVPGIVGALQTAEAIKLLTGMGATLAGRLLVVDVLAGETRTLRLRRSEANPLSGAGPSIHDVRDEPQACSAPLAGVEEIGVDELLALFERHGASAVLVDVREAHERAANSIGGLHVPMNDLAAFPAQGAAPAKHIVVYCESGVRSARAARQLADRLRDTRVVSLRGGMRGLRQGYRAMDDVRERLQACSA